jgi:hypothetical protein
MVANAHLSAERINGTSAATFYLISNCFDSKSEVESKF